MFCNNEKACYCLYKQNNISKVIMLLLFDTTLLRYLNLIDNRYNKKKIQMYKFLVHYTV